MGVLHFAQAICTVRTGPFLFGFAISAHFMNQLVPGDAKFKHLWQQQASFPHTLIIDNTPIHKPIGHTLSLSLMEVPENFTYYGIKAHISIITLR